MSEDMSVLRTTLLGSLLDSARHNAESGAIYLDADKPATTPAEERGSPLPLEAHALGAVLTGRVAPQSWRAASDATWDFYAAKGLLEAVFTALRVEWDVREGAHPFLHPGRTARVYSGETELGWLGEVHPLVARAWDLDGTVAAFEIDLGLAIAHAPEELPFTPFTSFPPALRDLAVTRPEGVTAAAILAVAREHADEAEVFDVYGDSLAMHLVFRAPDRTLTDDEVNARMEAIAAGLQELGVERRA
jgi:phenylalanyl-tRNA synthetase beta chain